MSGMVIESLENAMMAWLKSRLPAGWTAIWGDQNAPKPNPKEITLRRGTPYIRKVGRDVYGHVVPDGSRAVLGTREIAMELRGFGPGSMQILSDILSALDEDTVDDALLAHAITVFDAGPITNLAPIYDKQFKEVAMFEMKLRTHSLRESADAEQGVGYIQSVDLEVTTKDPAGAASVESIHVSAP